MTGCSSSGSTRKGRRIILSAALAFGMHAELSAQWASAGGPFGGSVVALGADTQYVYLGTTQGRIWRRPLQELVTGIRTPDKRPGEASRLALSSYPNPCNASAVLVFTVPRSCRATLSLVDMLGRTVMTVVDRQLDAGSHRFHVDLTSLSSGTYVALLTAGDVRIANRILLMR